MRYVGTVVRGIRTPIIKENDDLATIVVESLMNAKEAMPRKRKDLNSRTRILSQSQKRLLEFQKEIM